MKTSAIAESSLKTLKHKNRHSVLEYIRGCDTVSVAEIAKATGLSKMTVHNIIEHHLKNSVIKPAGKGESTDEGGKKPNLFAFNPDYRYIFTVKIVEQELLTALTNLRGDITASYSALYGRDTSLGEILRLVREAFTSLVKRQKVSPEHCIGAVVGCHGIVNDEEGICVMSPHFISWGVNVPIRDRIAALLPPNVPVYVDNWLRFHAYGEMKAAATPMRRFFLIGTEYDGLAGGLVLDGKIYHGAMGLSGEIGHMVVDPREQTVCACGGKGCLETVVSPHRIEERARERRNDWPESVLVKNKSHREATFDNILRAANAGDAFARSLLDASIGHFAVAINNLVHACDPGLVIIQGEYAKAGDYFLDNLRDRVNNLTLLRMKKSVRIEYSNQSDECTLTGAACFLADHYFAGLAQR